ncbi:MAG: ATP-binding protein [Clostridia bacterium]|nr:ATP-binding protein [Clostridia bacterium]
MDYIKLNKAQRDHMHSICHPDMMFDWQEQDIMDTFMGKLPSFHHVRETKESEKYVHDLKWYYETYDAYTTDQETFLDTLKTKIETIREVQPDWHGLSLEIVKKTMALHRFCLIAGDGGIGKSYFVMRLEENLEEKEIPHLCFYGKFKNSIDNIEVDQIATMNRFVLVIDAINEMSTDAQKALIPMLMKLKASRGCRIIITYRTHKMEPAILTQYQNLAEREYVFPGVSFESALDCLAQQELVDIHLYEDILYSNNALLLTTLKEVLSSPKLSERDMDTGTNNITTVTYIFERYIKRMLDNAGWQKTKKVAKWMYQNNQRYISFADLEALFPNAHEYIGEMLQNRLFIALDNDGVTQYEFGLEVLADFLIARSMMNEFPKDDERAQVDLIKDKREKMWELSEAIILVLFDRLSPDYARIKSLLEKTDLMNRFSQETMRKIIFQQEHIGCFQRVFTSPYNMMNFAEFGGYTNQPFNCSNYLNSVFLSNKAEQKKLSHELEGTHFLYGVMNRLKNILYSLNAISSTVQRVEEAFWFALWSSAAPNSDIRNLATKLLFDIVCDSEEYQTKLINVFSNIVDDYIKETIVFVLTKSNIKDRTVINTFFQSLIDDPFFLSARSMKRIAEYYGDPYCYIHWDKQNIRDDEFVASDEVEHVIRHFDLVESSFFPFRYWHKERVEMYRCFLDVDKKEIQAWNDLLNQHFKCVTPSSACCGSMCFAGKVEEMFDEEYRNCELSGVSFFRSFSKVAGEMLDQYSAKKRDGHYVYQDTGASTLVRKCLDVAIDRTLGSFMFNYFSNQFGTNNNTQLCLGYEVYDPMEYAETLPLTSPIPNYRSEIDGLDDIVAAKVVLPPTKDIAWANDVDLARKNLLSLIAPNKLYDHEWVMIAGRIRYRKDDGLHHTEWVDESIVWCCVSEDVGLQGDENDRYLTIELDQYEGPLSMYASCDERPWLCKQIPSLGSTTFDKLAETELVVPPAKLIADLELVLDSKRMVWVNVNNEVIIYCNNMKSSYYTSRVSRTVYMRKDVYEKYVQSHPFKFFAFTERFHPETGYNNAVSKHYEIINGEIVRECSNYNLEKQTERTALPDICVNCPHGFYRSREEQLSKLDELLIQFSYGENEIEE